MSIWQKIPNPLNAREEGRKSDTAQSAHDRKAIRRLMPTSHGPRQDSALAILACLLSNKTGEKQTGPYKSRRKKMRTLCRKAGVRYFCFHALRHSGASVMESANVPLGSIQRILGHENRSTTEIYLHSIGQAERHAMVVFEEARRKVTHRVTHNENPGEQELTVTH